MYEVRWTSTCGIDDYEPYDDESQAWGMYSEIIASEAIDSVGLYYTDGDGAERELASWSR